MVAAQLICDTDIIIDHLRQRNDTLRSALTRYRCAITAITLYELLAVPALYARQAHILDQLLSLVTVIPFDHNAAKQSADIWRSLNAQSQPIGLPDTFTAGTCLANNLPLLTRNHDHFSRVNNLRLLGPDDI